MRKKLEETLEFLLRDFDFGRYYCPDGKAPIERHLNLQPYDRLLIVLSGEKHEKMSLDGRTSTVHLVSGDYYLIRKMVWEYIAWDTPHELFCAVLRENYLRLVRYHVTDGIVSPGKWPASDWFHTNTVSNSLRQAFDLLSHLEYASDAELTRELTRSILRLSLHELRKETPRMGKAEMTFETIRNFIESHFSEEITRDSVAGNFGITGSYLSQLFQTRLHRTFSAYLLTCRMEKAKYLLSHSRLAVKEVACECGWPDDVYFIRRFREETGLSPGKFRLAARNDSRELSPK